LLKYGSHAEFHFIVFYCSIVLYCIVLYCIVLYCIVLYCIVLEIQGASRPSSILIVFVYILKQRRKKFCGFLKKSSRIFKNLNFFTKLKTHFLKKGLSFINLTCGHVMSHKKFGYDRFSRFDVYWIQTNRHPDKPNLYIEIVLYCIVLYCIVLYCIVLYCFVLCCIVLYCNVLFCIVLYCIVLFCVVLYCIVLYCFLLYCIVLYCIVLYCIVLYCIVLYCRIKSP